MNAMKRVAAGVHLPTPRLSEPAKCPEDGADLCLCCSSLPDCKHQVLVFTVEWTVARPMGEEWCGLGSVSIPSKLGHLAVPSISLPKGKSMAQSKFRTNDHSAPSRTLCRCPNWLHKVRSWRA